MKEKPQKNKWKTTIIILVILGFVSLILSGIFSSYAEVEGNVAVISIKGIIIGDGSSGIFGEGVASSTTIIKLIEKADKNPNIKAVILEINSPGGTPVASDEIARAVKKTNKTTVAWIRDYGASGAYWVASSSEHIVANPLSLTGSIGVFSSYLEFSGLLERYNITYERLVAGEYKDAGVPYRKLTEEERRIIIDELDKMHNYFIAEVASNRKLPNANVRKLANGRAYLGTDALNLGLIDELGGKDEALRYIERKHNITAVPVEYKEKVGILDVLGNVMSKQSFYVGQGIGSALYDKIEMNSYLRFRS